MTNDIATLERDKYERTWQAQGYYRVSPGELSAPKAWKAWGEPAGAKLNDYGCGSGRGSLWFQGAGMQVLGIDHVHALEPGLVIPFIERNLWCEGHLIPPSDYAYCCDVLEHIPPEYVHAVIKTIRTHTRADGQGWIQVAHNEDIGWGGEPLHLTVRDREWWADALELSGWKIVKAHALSDAWTAYHVTPTTVPKA